MKISEIFYSLQGEGLLAGVPSVFIRLAGCPLRCKWCDTRYAWDRAAGKDMSIDEIIGRVEPYSVDFAVITGGEPMVQTQLSALARRLKDSGRHITIETAGIVFAADLKCDLMSISPKLSNSTPADTSAAAEHEAARFNAKALRDLVDNYYYQLKFVVDEPDDLTEIRQVIAEIGGVDPRRVLLMPQAVTKAELLAKSTMVAELCKESGFVFGQRLQVLLWDTKRGA